MYGADKGYNKGKLEGLLGNYSRKEIWAVQTPQVFTKIILKLIRLHIIKFYGTDDASLVERLGKGVKLYL